MQQLTPSISVIIPTFNRFQMLKRALDSVLAQTFQDFEVILIDDASIDNTGEHLHTHFKSAIEKGIIRYIRNEKNKGRSACRNIGINLSNAEFITFLDDDDEWLPTHLANLFNFLKMHKDTGMAFSNWQTIDEHSKGAKPGTTGIKTGIGDYYLTLMLRAKIGYPSTCIIRSNLLKQTGGFKEALLLREDWELFTRCAMIGGIGFIDEPTVRIYVHAGSYSKNKSQWVNATEMAWNSILDFAKQHAIGIDHRLISERSLRLARGFISIGDFDKAKKYLSEAINSDPISVFSSIAIENIFKLLIGKKLYMWYKA